VYTRLVLYVIDPRFIFAPFLGYKYSVFSFPGEAYKIFGYSSYSSPNEKYKIHWQKDCIRNTDQR